MCSKRPTTFVALAVLLILALHMPIGLHAQSSPSISIELSPGHAIPLNTPLTATITLNNLDPASYSSLIFRGDLTEFDSHYPTEAAYCEDEDMGRDLTIEVNESEETFTVGVYRACSYSIYAHYTLDIGIFRADSLAINGKAELASAGTRFIISRYISAEETIPSAPTSETSAWTGLDLASLDIHVGEWVRIRPHSNVLLFFDTHVGVTVNGYPAAKFITGGLFYPHHIDVEEECKTRGRTHVSWRRAIHQWFHIAACTPGDAVVLIDAEKSDLPNLYRREFRILDRDENVASGQVTGVSVTEQVAQLRVSWNQAAEASGYKVQWKSGGQNYNESSRQHLVSSGATTEHTITNLSAGIEYTVQVIATKDNASDGPASTEATGTPLAQPPPPSTIADAPENLQTLAGNAQVALRWDAPSNDGGADITGYQYRQKESGENFSAWTDIPESGPGEANARSYTVTGLTNGQGYAFRVRAVNKHGGGFPAEVTVTLPSGVHTENEELPTEVMLGGNYPNPFNPETTIRYALPQAGNVRLAVYDLLGHEMAVLVDKPKPAGHHTTHFNAGDLPSGAYVYRLQAQDKIMTDVMMLVK